MPRLPLSLSTFSTLRASPLSNTAAELYPTLALWSLFLLLWHLASKQTEHLSLWGIPFAAGLLWLTPPSLRLPTGLVLLSAAAVSTLSYSLSLLTVLGLLIYALAQTEKHKDALMLSWQWRQLGSELTGKVKKRANNVFELPNAVLLLSSGQVNAYALNWESITDEQLTRYSHGTKLSVHWVCTEISPPRLNGGLWLIQEESRPDITLYGQAQNITLLLRSILAWETNRTKKLSELTALAQQEAYRVTFTGRYVLLEKELSYLIDLQTPEYPMNSAQLEQLATEKGALGIIWQESPPQVPSPFAVQHFVGELSALLEHLSASVPKQLPSLYTLFDLPETASAKDIQERYRELVKEWHPDRAAQYGHDPAEANRRMQEINEAYTSFRG